MKRDALEMWTVYDHPKDYPSCYVARLWRIEHGGAVATDSVLSSPGLMELREALAARGLTPLARNAADEPHIIETWI